MAITATDVKIEQGVKQEEIRELRELKKALDLIEKVEMWAKEAYRKGYGIVNSVSTINDWRVNLEVAAREIANARVHQARLRSLAKRLYRDIKDIRSARGEKGRQVRAFLTKTEANTLARCNSIKFVLDEAFAKAQQARDHLFNGSYQVYVVREDVARVYRSVMYAFNLVFDLFRIDKQVEEALEAATKPEAR